MVYKRNNNHRETKLKRGRPSSYNPKLFPRQAYIACSELGAFDEELAKLFGVTPETIHQWKRKYDDFSLAIKRGVVIYGNKIAIKNVRKLAEGFYYDEYDEEEIILSQGRGKERISVPAIKKTIKHKYSLPNMGALAFWLKNKLRDGDPDDPEDTGWKDYRAIELSNSDNGPLNINVTMKE